MINMEETDIVLNKRKRNRSANFSYKEEQVLVGIVKKYAKIIECKQTDAVSINKKANYWNVITREFNSNNERPRSVEVLKNKYENLKKNTKKKFADEKTFNRGTGGGPYKNVDITDINVAIKDMLGTRVTGRESYCDSDMTESQNIEIYVENSTANESTDDMVANEDVEEEPVLHKDLMVNDEAELEHNEIENWRPFNFSEKKFSADELCTPISEALRCQKQKNATETQIANAPNIKKTKKIDPLKTKLGQWANNKTELVEMQKRHLEEEHRKKLEHLDTKNALELKFMRLEHEARISALLNH